MILTVKKVIIEYRDSDYFINRLLKKDYQHASLWINYSVEYYNHGGQGLIKDSLWQYINPASKFVSTRMYKNITHPDQLLHEDAFIREFHEIDVSKLDRTPGVDIRRFIALQTCASFIAYALGVKGCRLFLTPYQLHKYCLKKGIYTSTSLNKG